MSTRTRAVGLGLWLAVITGLVAQDPSLKTPDAFPRFPPVAPADVGKTFVVQHGFEMQLIAAEPLVTDPVAMAIDENGGAFVVEMNDYPYTDPKTHQAWKDNTTDAPIGRIRWLEDGDHDGRFDRSVVFAEGLSWPSGIACYRGGVFVTATPDVWYLKDTDGDHRADVRERVFSGFRKYNVQAVMNNPIWGLDNKLYVAGSSNGGSVVAPGTTQEKPIAARGDFRFDPQTRELELQAGGARFGNAFDDWGNRFLCNIRNPAIHVVLDNAYLARNPYYAVPSAIYNIAEAGDQMPVYRISPIEPWRELRGRQWSADPTKKLPRSELTGGGVFTSTSGINVVRGDAYPDEFQGQLLVAEVANNVIYRQTIVEDGNTFRAERADKGVEFVASTDTWFRPVNLVNAPDGTVYVLDMYREFIEHPWSIPDDIHARLDLRSGSDRGRIYRLAPSGWQQPAFRPLSSASGEQLVGYLSSPNAWVRETAQRLLFERQDKSLVPALSALLNHRDPRAVLHSLWTLHGLGSLQRTHLLSALEHSSPHVVEHAVRLSEPLMGSDAEILDKVAALCSHASSRVRLQAALSLGNHDNALAVESLSRLARTDGADTWMRAALCSATPTLVPKILERLVTQATTDESEPEPVIDALMQTSAGMPDRTAIVAIMQQAAQRPASSTGVRLSDRLWLSLFQHVRRKGTCLHETFDDASRAALKFESLIASARRTALDQESLLIAREAATVQLTLSAAEPGIADLVAVVDQSPDNSVVVLAVQAIGSYKSTAVAAQLIERLKRLTPVVREEALGVLLARPDRALALLDAIQAQRVPAGLLGLPRKSQLLASSNPTVKSRAETVLGAVDAARSDIVKKYLRELPATGEAARGQELFRKYCANCHRAAGFGIEIGPHMETVRNWDNEKLLTNIIDPNRELAPQSMAYSIALQSGTTVSGMITEETAGSLVIKRASVASETLLREDIDSMTNTGLSLMPAGFEESLTPQQMADLIAYLRQP